MNDIKVHRVTGTDRNPVGYSYDACPPPPTPHPHPRSQIFDSESWEILTNHELKIQNSNTMPEQ